MRRKRQDPRKAEIEALIREIKDVNDAAKFQPDPLDRDRLLAEKSSLQSHLLRNHGEAFSILPEGRGIVGIHGRDDDSDACHAKVDSLDPDVRDWVQRQIKASRGGR